MAKSKPATADRDHLKVTVKGQGYVEIQGTREFVRNHVAHVQAVLNAIMVQYVEAEVAKGRPRQEVVAEVQREIDTGLRHLKTRKKAEW
jgi:hypothetical protein